MFGRFAPEAADGVFDPKSSANTQRQKERSRFIVGDRMPKPTRIAIRCTRTTPFQPDGSSGRRGPARNVKRDSSRLFSWGKSQGSENGINPVLLRILKNGALPGMNDAERQIEVVLYSNPKGFEPREPGVSLRHPPVLGRNTSRPRRVSQKDRRAGTPAGARNLFRFNARLPRLGE